MSKNIGIDLGTANTLAYVKGSGISLREPSVIAVNKRFGKVIAVGGQAKDMLGKTPEDIEVYRPLKNGVIAEFGMSKVMLKMFIDRIAKNNKFFLRPDIIICIPYGITEVEKIAAFDAVLEAGARTVAVIEEPIAAAIGAGIDTNAPKGSLIVDIGGGTTEVAVISCGGIVISNSIKAAGDKMNEAIANEIQRKFGVLIGDSIAEDIKIAIGSVHPYVDRGSINIIGRSVTTGLPESITVCSSDTEEALRDIVEELADSIRKTLEATPPELSGDILDDGIILTGGGCLLGGLEKLIREMTGLPVKVAESPAESVIRGIGTVIEDIDNYKSLLNFIKYK